MRASAVFPDKHRPWLKSTDKKASVRHEGQQPELHYLCIAQLMTCWRPCRKDGGGQAGRLAAHFCINLQIDSIGRGETGEGGRQAGKQRRMIRPPGQGIRHCQNCFVSGYWTSGARYEPAYHLPGHNSASPEHTGPCIWPPLLCLFTLHRHAESWT